MAKIYQPTEDEQLGLEAWVATRPPAVQDLIARVPPNHLYLLKTSGHRVFPVSYAENGTLTVAVTGKYNLLAFERQVFGIRPDDLEECDLPGPDERVGAPSESVQEQIVQAVRDLPENKRARLRNNPGVN